MYLELTLVIKIKNVYVFEIACWTYVVKEHAELSLLNLGLKQIYEQCNIKRTKILESEPNSGC